MAIAQVQVSFTENVEGHRNLHHGGYKYKKNKEITSHGRYFTASETYSYRCVASTPTPPGVWTNSLVVAITCLVHCIYWPMLHTSADWLPQCRNSRSVGIATRHWMAPDVIDRVLIATTYQLLIYRVCHISSHLDCRNIFEYTLGLSKNSAAWQCSNNTWSVDCLGEDEPANSRKTAPINPFYFT